MKSKTSFIWIILMFTMFAYSVNAHHSRGHDTKYDNSIEIITNNNSTIEFLFTENTFLFDDTNYNYEYFTSTNFKGLGVDDVLYLNLTYGYKLFNNTSSKYIQSENLDYDWGPGIGPTFNYLYIENGIRNDIYFYLDISFFECFNNCDQPNNKSIVRDGVTSSYQLYVSSATVYPIIYKNMFYGLVVLTALLGVYVLNGKSKKPQNKIKIDKIKSFIPLRTDSAAGFIASLISFGIVNISALTVLGALWFFAAWGGAEDGFYVGTGLLASFITSLFLVPLNSVDKEDNTYNKHAMIIITQILIYMTLVFIFVI